MSKVIFKFDNKSSLWYKEQKYNDLLVKSQMLYLKDIFKMHGLIIIKDIFDIFRIDYNTVSTEELLRYWKLSDKNDDLDIEYHRNDDGSYTFVCDTDN